MLYEISKWFENVLIRCVIADGYDHHWGWKGI